MISKSLFALTLMTSVSFAQTKPAPKPTPKPVAVAPKTVLESAKGFAQSEVVRLEKEMETMGSSSNISPCAFYEKKVQLKYNQWFLEPAHYEAFEKLNTSIDSAIAEVNAKLEALENETVNVLVQEGANAKTSEVPVAFKDLISFFRLYNQRMVSCPKNEKAALTEMMESEPISNSMNIVLSQIRAAGGMMSVNLNASLQETDITYELVMEPKNCGYSLDLLVKSKDSPLDSYRFSLLDGDQKSQKISFGDQEKWEILSRGTLDGMPVDGLLRYRKIQDQFKGKCDQESISVIPYKRRGTPFVEYEKIPGIVTELKKNGYLPGMDMDFVKIDAGTFLMGENDGQHTVVLTKNFEIQSTEVTQSQWFKVMRHNPSQFKEKEHCPNTWIDGMCPQNPVEQVTWNDVQVFIQALNQQQNDGYVYRLPTEAEWEYAARGETATSYFNGNNTDKVKDIAWYEANSESHTHEVASAGAPNETKANAYGLYDMHGNVWEWVGDIYGGFDQEAKLDPRISNGSYGTIRGGSWNDAVQNVRIVTRDSLYQYYKDGRRGFRLARTLKEAPAVEKGK